MDKNLSAREIDGITQKYLGKSISVAFEEYFAVTLPERINTHHRMIIIASQLDDASERIVEYLAAEYSVDINAIFFNFFKSKDQEFLGRSWLMDPVEVSERSESKKEMPWTGYLFVNVGEGEHRNWDDCRTYGFLSAGQGKLYSDAMKRLKKGDRVFAYLKGMGYVGFGTVTQEAVMAKDFVVEASGIPLKEVSLKQLNIFKNEDSEELADWVVSVQWAKTFPREEAKWLPKLFANQNIVCKLRDQQTFDFLRREFDIQE